MDKARVLPTWNSYTVDIRLGEFRKDGVEFIAFGSEEGDTMLTAYIKTLDVSSYEFDEIARLW